MEPLIRTISAWDGLPLRARIWDGGDRAPPILCLPGLVRTGADFDIVAPGSAEGRRVVSLDYAGRGESGRSSDINRYAPEACLRDVLDVCAALHLHAVTIVGTSFGGLLSMAIAAARPALLRGVVLNDVGPEIGAGGADFVRDFVALDPALESLDACVTFLKQRLPPLSLSTDDDWRAMAALTYAPGADGRFHPVWDTAIARLLHRPAPDLWPLFGALAHVPVLLLHGALSTILLPSGVAAMQACRPDMTVVTVPDVGHAPILTEAAVRDTLAAFLTRTTGRVKWEANHAPKPRPHPHHPCRQPARPDDLIELNRAFAAGETNDATALRTRCETAVAEVVERQRAIGIDVPNDGEFGKATEHRINFGAWWSYIYPRWGGLRAGGDMMRAAPRRPSLGASS